MFRKAKMFPRLISNSGKRKIREKSLRKISRIFYEVAFLDLDFTEWAELALPIYNNSFNMAKYWVKLYQ